MAVENSHKIVNVVIGSLTLTAEFEEEKAEVEVVSGDDGTKP